MPRVEAKRETAVSSPVKKQRDRSRSRTPPQQQQQVNLPAPLPTVCSPHRFKRSWEPGPRDNGAGYEELCIYCRHERFQIRPIADLIRAASI